MSKLHIVDKNGKPYDSSMFDDFNSIWNTKISDANNVFSRWSTKFKTVDCEQYYYGRHWEIPEGVEYEPYQTNEIFVALDVKQPTLLFSSPQYSVKPKPGRSNVDIDAASRRAFLRESVLNYFATNEETQLAESTELAILDAFFRFGVVEVGYSSDWVDNPLSGKLVLDLDRSTDFDYDDPQIVYEPSKLPANERLFVKHINAENFRVGGLSNAGSLESCDWCGYWEWFRIDDLIAHYGIADLYRTNTTSDFYTGTDYYEDSVTSEFQEIINNSKLCRVWKIWDNREKQKLMFLENTARVFSQKPFNRLPIIDLRFRKQLKSWYPMPPVFNWLSPQDEMNDVRETARAHRKRFIRKYLLQNGALDETNKARLQNGLDGTIVETIESGARLDEIVSTVPNMDLGAHHAEMLQVSRIDFDNIAGVTPQQRGQATGETATESNLIDARTGIRESRDQEVVAKFLCRIGKEILLQAKENIVNDIIIPIVNDVDETITPIGEFQLNNQTWEEINMDTLGDEDMDVIINVSSLSPVNNEKDKKAFIEFLSLMTNFPQLNLSPELVREAAVKTGYHNEKVIQTWQQMALLQLTAQMNQLTLQNAMLESQSQQLQMQDNSNKIAQREVAQNNPNTQDQINQQINNQVLQ